MKTLHTLAALALCVAAALPAAALESISLSNAVHVVEVPAEKAFRHISCLSDGSSYMTIMCGGHVYECSVGQGSYGYGGGSYYSSGSASPFFISTDHVIAGPCTVQLGAVVNVYSNSAVNIPAELVETRSSGMALFTYEVYDASGRTLTPPPILDPLFPILDPPSYPGGERPPPTRIEPPTSTGTVLRIVNTN